MPLKLALFFSALSYAQQIIPVVPPPPAPERPEVLVEVPDEDAIIRTDVRMVSVMATVRGKRDAIMTDLTAEDFKILEDGKEQQIRAFSRETDLPLSIALLIDASQSMDTYFRDEQRMAARFLESIIRPGDEALVGAFRTQTELLQDLTGDINLLRNGLVGLTRPLPPATGTVLYDAIVLATNRRLANRPGRKVMVVLSDWADYGSRNSLDRALEVAQKAEVMIYGISFPLAAGMGGMFGGEANRALDTLTTKTGGRQFRATTGKDLEKIFAQIEDEVRSQYSIAYSPTNEARDGKYRKIQIKMSKGEYKVQARDGYYGPRK